jgi:hypothetical protein
VGATAVELDCGVYSVLIINMCSNIYLPTQTLKVTSTPLHSIGLSNILNIETVNRSFRFKLLWSELI